jgi:hypothetical protein
MLSERDPWLTQYINNLKKIQANPKKKRGEIEE